MGKKFHCHTTKPYLIKAILEEGGTNVLKDFDGTDDEAIELVIEHPYKYVPLTDCGNLDEDGRCAGHPQED